MNKLSVKDFSKEVTLTDMQGKAMSKIQDIDYEAYSLALEKYITILEKALDIACGDVECRDCSFCNDSTNERCIYCKRDWYMKRSMEDE